MTAQPKPVVLVADDDPDILELVTEHLGDRYEVVLAHDGLEAIQVLGERRASIGAVVLDLRMPTMGGIRVLEYLQWARLSAPVILHTANAAMAQLLRGEAAVTSVLVKPAGRQALLREVEAALQGVA
jgi:CheY-like chemotaxis protein